MSEDKVINTISKIISDTGMKKKAVAERANLTDRQFSDILHHRRKINADDVIPLCSALNISPNVLFGFNEDKSA